MYSVLRFFGWIWLVGGILMVAGAAMRQIGMPLVDPVYAHIASLPWSALIVHLAPLSFGQSTALLLGGVAINAGVLFALAAVIRR